MGADPSLLRLGRNTIGYNATDPGQSKIKIGDGWFQGVMNVALLGLADEAAGAVLGHAQSKPSAMRFPTCLLRITKVSCIL